MLAAIATATITFVVIFAGLRLAEWLYHRWRRTPDWSPHWGSWVFAVLCGLYVFAVSWGR
jgi:hypothetical protein